MSNNGSHSLQLSPPCETHKNRRGTRFSNISHLRLIFRWPLLRNYYITSIACSSSTINMFSLTLAQIGNWPFQLTIASGFITVFWVLLKLWRRTRERQIRIIPASYNGIHVHQWSLIECLTHNATCCMCKSLIVDAMLCDSCGICLDFSCYQKALKSNYLKPSFGEKSLLLNYESLNQCKKVSIAADEQDKLDWKHHWIHGNVPDNSVCFVCKGFCEQDYCDGGDSLKSSGDQLEHDHTLYHYRCCWCQRTIHENCFIETSQYPEFSDTPCDFGLYRRYIIPPFCVVHKFVWSSSVRQGRKAKILELVSDFSHQQPNWSPLFIIANRKSGNNDGGSILSTFLPILNTLQVVDLSNGSLELSLQICKMLPSNVMCRILVAGGDGTVGWVLDTIIRMKIEPAPVVAILPLGTGNDLARVLGWSELFQFSNLDRDQIIDSIYKSVPINLDRWSVSIRSTGYYRRSYNLLVESLHIPKSIMPPGNRNLFMYNYLSVGVDALVALNFHETRKSKLYNFLFANTLINKFIYFTYGTKDLLERRCKNLQRKIRLELDGSLVELPELESVILLNISSWGGGVKLLHDSVQQNVDDGLLEVVGVTSSFHIGQLMMGLSKPIFLGQARVVKIHLLEHLPVQADGEPWLQHPAKIEIKWNSHAKLLQYCED